jgi:GTP cyclohydrolase FolE2
LPAGTIDVDLHRGPRAEAPYIEQQASILIYTGEFQSTPSRLNIIIKYLSWQARHKVSDVAIDELFQSLREDIVPTGKDVKGNDIVNNMPSSRSEARKVIKEVGFDYVVIDACPCDQTLYYGDR